MRGLEKYFNVRRSAVKIEHFNPACSVKGDIKAFAHI